MGRIPGFLVIVFFLSVLDALTVYAQNITYGPYNNLQYPDSVLQTALLVQRDISVDIPISHILLPGVNLTASWFWDRNYSLDNVSSIPTLFYYGYRRFELDLWWDNDTSSFQLCPEQIVPSISDNSTRLVTTTVTSLKSTVLPTSTSFFNVTLTNTMTSVAPYPSAILDPSEPMSLANNYTCAPAANLQLLLDAIQYLMVQTDSALKQAGLFLLILNLHALPSVGPANTTIDLSISSNQSLSDQVNATLGSWLYSPTNLASERQNINASFLLNPQYPILNITAYYTLDFNNVTNTASTPDGWPSTKHLFDLNGRRFLAGFGNINLPPNTYDISQDTSLIFPPGTFGGADQLISSTSITNSLDSCSGPAGVVFGPTGVEDFNSTDIGGNITFATSENPSFSALSYNDIQNIVTCGLSPIVDSPLQNTTSGLMSPYTDMAGTIWSWKSPSQPENVTIPTNGTSDVFACAAMFNDTGKWVVLDCSTQLQTACRINNTLYEWEIGPFESNYFQASTACPKGSAFSVPRTALENRFLLAALRKTDLQSIWVDLNSLKAPNCWVIGNANCPYGNSNSLREQKVIVPIVASILVITVFLLMCLVKWQRYWQVRAARKRRRLVKGFLQFADYEGIPA